MLVRSSLVHSRSVRLMSSRRCQNVLISAIVSELLFLECFALHEQSRRPPENTVAWSRGQLALQIPAHWADVQGPIATACISGDDRVGKSTLATLWGRSLLRSEEFDFPIGHKRSSHTRGLWSALLPAGDTGLRYHLNLCDSQGLKQVSEIEQGRLFAANVLLPGVLVYMVVNVIQNDQLRDLARMAQQFQKLSADEFQRFGKWLSPHLIVVVREESDLDDGGDLTAHLEDTLNGPSFTEEKELIRRVFHNREAWSLDELPQSARRALKTTGSVPLTAASDAWRSSGLHVLQRMLAVIEAKRAVLPQSGRELSEWYQSVVETVNSQEAGSLGRLLDLRERVAAEHQWRRGLELVTATFGLLVAVLLLTCGDSLGRWLDRLVWCAWVALCVFHVGSSSWVTETLRSLLGPLLCGSGDDEKSGSIGQGLLRAACEDASARLAALVSAAILGMVTYRILKIQMRWLTGMFPIRRLLLSSAALALAVASASSLGMFPSMLGVVDLGAASSNGKVTLCAWLSLLLSAVVSGAETAAVANHNRSCSIDGDHCISIHRLVAARVEEVRALEASPSWREHYRRHAQRDAIWRHRQRPMWLPAATCAQAIGLLSWAWLIQPRCDRVLAFGAFANALHLTWMLGRGLSLCAKHGQNDSVARWITSLETDKETADDISFADGFHDSDVSASPLLPETSEEIARRRSIEEMRYMSEPGAMSTLRRRSASPLPAIQQRRH